jgi:uncharacterized protein (TIGR03083 family)
MTNAADIAMWQVAVADESDRFAGVLEDVPPTAAVPTCQGWTAADLLWHLTEVQDQWAQVVGTLTDDPGTLEPVERPEQHAALQTLFADRSAALRSALADRAPDDGCWSWHEDGGTVGWVARRQAHEALLHRVDAELTAGVQVATPATDLAVDGVDEVLAVMLHGVPHWASFEPDGTAFAVHATDAARVWTLTLGRMLGTSPTSGRSYDLDAALLATQDEGAEDVRIAGQAWDLDRWLWGRLPDGDGNVEVAGADGHVERVRALLVDATQ